METLTSKITAIIGFVILLTFITLSYNYNQFFLTEILICSFIIGCLVLMKMQSRVKRTTTVTRKALKTKTTENELSKSYSEQYT